MSLRNWNSRAEFCEAGIAVLPVGTNARMMDCSATFIDSPGELVSVLNGPNLEMIAGNINLSL